MVASMSAIVGLPHLAIDISISSRRIFNTRRTPRSPFDGQAPEQRTTDEYRSRSQRQSLHDIGTSPDASV